jgi:hypothetical protein
VAARRRSKGLSANRRGGRPTKSAASKVARLKAEWLEAFRERGWNGACRLVGISTATPSNWRRSDARFAAACEAAKDGIADLIERRLDDIALGLADADTVTKGAVTAAVFRLKALRPQVYRDRVSAELSGPGGGPIPHAGIGPGDAERARELIAQWATGGGTAAAGRPA